MVPMLQRALCKMGGQIALGVVCAVLLSACDPSAPRTDAPERAVDTARLRAPEPESWLAHGRTQDEQRFSPLTQIHEGNVADLGLAWSFDLETERGVEATPLVADGVVYVTGPWSVLYALDARNGELLWKWDPEVPRAHARYTCCGVVNRGAALYDGKVFVGTLDGRLAALDAATGVPVWEVLTVDPEQPYSITGAPRIVEGLVVIGNGGADLGVRGYVSAYAAETGAMAWRTYTVPGDPARGFESEALERAAQTWTGEWWRAGGGGTVWDSMAYDPELGLLYIGTGNGAPYPRWLRSPDGGDNLFLASILALRPEDGEIVWHYQTTPAETWDYTATQHIVLADLEIGGRQRKVLMQAPKNGFFYVIDRETGEFISAEPFAEVTWATGIDENGRPIEAADVDYSEEARFVKPSPLGAHNWQPMSFNPETGLVYIPAKDMGSIFKMDPDWQYIPGDWNIGLDFSGFKDFGSEALEPIRAFLLAWDPVSQRAVWSVEHVTGSNGGTLTTAGNLVFQGTADGRFVAYRASNGTALWESPAGTGVMAPPITYTLDGVQYVVVAAGWGAAFAMGAADMALKAGVRGGGRVLAFALGGTAELPAGREPLGPPPIPTFRIEATAAERVRGADLYHRYCGACHGPTAIGGGSGVPDLRYTTASDHELFESIVLGGLRLEGGMPVYADRLSPADVHSIQAWVLQRAAESAASARP